MTSPTDLREVIGVAIGVDTHVHIHLAATVDARNGGVLDEITIEATADGYAEVVEAADEHAALRAWGSKVPAAMAPARPDTSSSARDRDRARPPERAKRRHGARSDPLDAIRRASAAPGPTGQNPLRGRPAMLAGVAPIPAIAAK